MPHYKAFIGKAMCQVQKCYQFFKVTVKKKWKSAQRDANTAHTLAVVRFGHRPPAPPAHCHKPTERTNYNTLRCS